MESDRNNSSVRNSSPAKRNSPPKNNSKITITNSTESLSASKGTRPRSSEVTPITRRTGSFSGDSSQLRTHTSVAKVRISAGNLELTTEEAIFMKVQDKLLKIANK